MLHTKFRGNQPAGSGEEGFLRVFTIQCGQHIFPLYLLLGETGYRVIRFFFYREIIF